MQPARVSDGARPLDKLYEDSKMARSACSCLSPPCELVSAAAGADTAVARASIAVAAEPVGRPRFEWVVPLRLLGLRLLDQMLVTVYPMVGVLSRISRHRGRRYNAKRQRQD